MTIKKDTRIVTAGRDHQHNIVNPPVFHASTVLFPTLADLRHAASHPNEVFYYGRRATPTSIALCDALAELETDAAGCVLFPSGLAALAIALMGFLESGEHLLMVDTVYQPTRGICDRLLARQGIETTYYDPMIGDGIAKLIRPNTRVVFVEAPGSLTFEVQDIPAIAACAHDAGALVMMDNTWASPFFFQPFERGVDVCIQAATKYIVGHSDVMLGVATANAAHWPRLRDMAHLHGQCAGPDDIYLALRGLRTLAVRLRQHELNALKLARWFKARPEVARVLHPGLPECPGHETWQRDFLGSSGLFSVVLKGGGEDALAALLNGLKLFSMGYSWGGYESLALPIDPARSRSATPWDAPGPTVRFHIGLEDPEDLIADLEAGLARYRAAL